MDQRWRGDEEEVGRNERRLDGRVVRNETEKYKRSGEKEKREYLERGGETRHTKGIKERSKMGERAGETAAHQVKTQQI